MIGHDSLDAGEYPRMIGNKMLGGDEQPVDPMNPSLIGIVMVNNKKQMHNIPSFDPPGLSTKFSIINHNH